MVSVVRKNVLVLIEQLVFLDGKLCDKHFFIDR